MSVTMTTKSGYSLRGHSGTGDFSSSTGDVSHAMTNATHSLCGVECIAMNLDFDPTYAWACKRCVKALAKIIVAAPASEQGDA